MIGRTRRESNTRNSHLAPTFTPSLRFVYRDKQSFLWWLPIGDCALQRPRRRIAAALCKSIRSVGSACFDEQWPVIECESLGPGLPANSKLASYWGQRGPDRERGHLATGHAPHG